MKKYFLVILLMFTVSTCFSNRFEESSKRASNNSAIIYTISEEDYNKIWGLICSLDFNIACTEYVRLSDKEELTKRIDMLKKFLLRVKYPEKEITVEEKIKLLENKIELLEKNLNEFLKLKRR